MSNFAPNYGFLQLEHEEKYHHIVANSLGDVVLR